MNAGRSRGFSLVEALIALLLVAVLAVILLPVIDLISGRSKAVVCNGNLRQLGIGLLTYAADNNGLLPDSPVTEANPKGAGLQWDAQIAPILRVDRNAPARHGKTLYFCPEAKKCTDTHFGRSYAYNNVIASNLNNARQRNAQVNPSRLLLLLEVQILPDGRAWTLFGGNTNRPLVTQTNVQDCVVYPHAGFTYVLFADGHVDRCLPRRPSGVPPVDLRPEGVEWVNQ